MSVIIKTRHQVTNLVAIHRADPCRFPFLLDSAPGLDRLAEHNRFSILLAFPQHMINCHSYEDGPRFFQQLKDQWSQLAIPSESSMLPFRGGWFVYLSYEFAQVIEPVLRLPPSIQSLPLAFAARCPAAIIVDHQQGKTYYVVEEDYRYYLSDLLGAAQRHSGLDISQLQFDIEEEDTSCYLAGVERILDYIVSGDVFQVNLSRQWWLQPHQSVPGIDLYQILKQVNPAPFACMIFHDQGEIIGSSPERLVCVRKGRVSSRPIAGTRPHTQDRHNRRWLRELCQDKKEQAEHIMLIDLARNDMGRVCVPGSIEVNELMGVETYAYVHHIVSNVHGQLQPQTTPVDVLQAVFPGGTITGCPKIRCMEIIAQLELAGRGPYTGSVGYINHDGSMDFNILIRSLLHQEGRFSFRTGAGIVADSVADHELKETRHKAKGLLRAFCASR